MKFSPKWLIFIVVFFVLVGVVYLTQFQSYRYNDISKTMDETIKITIVKNMDHSIRANENTVILNKEGFEEDFKKEFQKTNVKMGVKQYKFDYLTTKEGYLKAVKAKIIDDEDSPYQVTYVTDIDK